MTKGAKTPRTSGTVTAIFAGLGALALLNVGAMT